MLYLEWASLKNWYKKQPLWLIKNYFGVKIGLYFAWLGFYTQMLVAPAIAGIICFIFGIATVWSPIFNQGRYLFNMKNYFKNINNYNCFLNIHSYRSSEEICSDDIFGKLDMCPECDKYCNYWQLSNSCFLSRITYLFDNSSTVLFAIFMTVWGRYYFNILSICLCMWGGGALILWSQTPTITLETWYEKSEFFSESDSSERVVTIFNC